MKNLIFCLMFFIYLPSVFAESHPRYKSRSEYRNEDTAYADRKYSSEDSNNGSRSQRYQSKPSSERQRFDKNLNRYNRYSPEQKRQAQEKWQNFKEETTPAEREFILQKMRKDKNRGR